MSNPYEKRCNEEWLERVLEIAKTGGKWLWPDVGQMFQINGGKFEPKEQEGYDELKEIVSPEWFKCHVAQREEP
jgi:hypothetical protein